MKSVVTYVDVAAAPAKVWEVLMDFPSHAEWNPFIRSIAGRPTPGEKLIVHIAPPGAKGMTFKPKVLAADPEREFRWRGSLFVPGLFDGEHFFRLEKTEVGTRLSHGENFSGMLTAAMPASSFQAIEQGFEAMNVALKHRAEG